MEPTGSFTAETVVHRIGGSGIENLRLKKKEETLDPPGISVFVCGTAAEAAGQIRETFPHATQLLEASARVATASVAAIRQAGFDVVPDPTRHFINHARLIHPDGVAGFTEQNLADLSIRFDETLLETN